MVWPMLRQPLVLNKYIIKLSVTALALAVLTHHRAGTVERKYVPGKCEEQWCKQKGGGLDQYFSIPEPSSLHIVLVAQKAVFQLAIRIEVTSGISPRIGQLKSVRNYSDVIEITLTKNEYRCVSTMFWPPVNHVAIQILRSVRDDA